MTRRYAEGTEVDVYTSRAEIERTLARYGATEFAYGSMVDRAIIGFRANDRAVRFELPMPDREDFRRTPEKGLLRSQDQQQKCFEQAQRQAWRALALAIKAKLETVAAGISTFEEEFLAHIVLPGDGRTIGQWIRPQLEEHYAGGKPVALLPAPGSRS